MNNNPFGSSIDGNVQLKAGDNAWGFRLATMFKINDKNQVGLMYRSPIQHKYVGNVYIDGINTAVYSGYGFTTSTYQTRAEQKLVLPQSIILGYSFKPTKKWTFNFDLEWMNWSKVKQDLISYPDETSPTRLSFLGASNVERHWHSVFSEAIGAEYAANDRLRLRAGYYHHAHSIPQGTFDSALPDSNSHGLTTGFGYDLTKHLSLDVAYSGLIYEERKVNNTVGSAAGANISGKYNQFTHIGMVTVTYKF